MMVKKASPHLIAIAEQREPTEEEAQELTLRLVDDAGERGEIIDLTSETVTALKEKGLIHYCDHCTRNTILACADDADGGYTAAEYHTVAFNYGFAGRHSYRCLAESGIEVPDIEKMIDEEEDDLCNVCKEQNSRIV